MVSTKIVHTSGTFLETIENMSKNAFNLCSHIELDTQNPNPIFKIKIYYTKHSQYAKILSNVWNMLEKFENNKNLLFISLQLQIPYFILCILFFEILCFCNFVYLGIYTYVYVTPCARHAPLKVCEDRCLF